MVFVCLFFVLYVCGLSSLLSLYVIVCVLEYALVFVLNEFEVSMLVGIMCLWVVCTGLCMVLLVYTLGCCVCFIVLVSAKATFFFKLLNVLVFRVLVDFGFVFGLLYVFLKTILIPHTRVCGLSRGGRINVFVIFCGSTMYFVVHGILVFIVILCISLVMFLVSAHLFPYTRVYGFFRDGCFDMIVLMFLS